jgi:DNA repair protein RadC
MNWNQAQNITKFMLAAASADSEEALILVVEDHDSRCYVHVLDNSPANETRVSDDKIKALLANAVRCMLLHNHPPGEGQPSEADIAAANVFEDLCHDLGVMACCGIMSANRIKWIFYG